MGQHAKGVQLQLSDGGATPVYTTIAEITNLDGPGVTVPTAETTHHQSTAATHAGGIPDWGEVTIEGNWLPTDATHDEDTGLVSLLHGTENDYKIVWPDAAATEWALSAILSAFRPSAPYSGKLSFSATLKLSGACAIT